MNYIIIPGIRRNNLTDREAALKSYGGKNMDTILEIVGGYFHVEVALMKTKSRQRSISYPRHIAMWLIYKTTSFSLKNIGDFFGGQDHSTVVYARDSITDLIKVDYRVQEDAENLLKLL